MSDRTCRDPRRRALSCEDALKRAAADRPEPGYRLVPVGYIRSSLKRTQEAPRQGRDAGLEACIEVLPAFLPALEGLSAPCEVQVICWMHLAPRDTLQVRRRGDATAPLVGVFSTRSPARPNPLAIYTARLLEVRGNTLRVAGIDAVDGTPVVDLKPHVPRLDD